MQFATNTSSSGDIQRENVFISKTEDSIDDWADPSPKYEQEILLEGEEWTPEEERAIVRRLDFYLIPLVMIMFFTLNLDRGNISNALTGNFMKDLNINQEIVNTGNSLVFVGICIGDIPANMIIQKIGADIWLPCQLIAWALVATFQAFVKNRSGFLATRFLLGLCESGFIPGTLWFLTKWYTKAELGKRTVFFFVGSYMANLLNNLIAYGLLHLHGKANLAGWQWLFLVDGLATLLVGIITLFLLPRSITHPNNLFKCNPFTKFTPHETRILLTRLTLDNPYSSDPLDSSKSQLKILWIVLTDWKVWAHCSMALLGLEYSPPIGIYSPSIIKSFGFGTFNSNLLVTPNSALLIVSTLALAWWSDKVYSRSVPILFAALWLLVGLIVLDVLPHDRSNWYFYAFLVLTGGSPSWHPLNIAWLSSNQPHPRRRAIALALYMSLTNLSGVPASHIFQGSDAPRYHKGFKILFVMAAVAMGLMVFMRFVYWWKNRRMDREKGSGDGEIGIGGSKGEGDSGGRKDEGDDEERGKREGRFRYQL